MLPPKEAIQRREIPESAAANDLTSETFCRTCLYRPHAIALDYACRGDPVCHATHASLATLTTQFLIRLRPL